MTSYYVVKLYTAYQRASPDYLGPRRNARGEVAGLGVVNVMEATHFLQVEEALEALKKFMADFAGERIVRGQVFSVTEEAIVGYEIGDGSVVID